MRNLNETFSSSAYQPRPRALQVKHIASVGGDVDQAFERSLVHKQQLEDEDLILDAEAYLPERIEKLTRIATYVRPEEKELLAVKLSSALNRAKMTETKANAVLSDVRVRSAAWMPVYLQIRQPPVGERMGADSTKEMTLIIKKAADDWAFAKACSEDLKTTHDVSAILAVALDALAQIGKQGVGKILDWMETVLTENVKKCEDLRAYVTDRDWDNLKKNGKRNKRLQGTFLAWEKLLA